MIVLTAAILQNDGPPCPSQSHSPSHGPKLSPVKSTEHSRARFHLNPVAWLRSILSPALSTSSLAPSPCPSTPQRRALLIGITYAGSKTWPELYGPHRDVDHYQELLTSMSPYSSLIAFPFSDSDSRSYIWISPGRHHHTQGSP